MYDTSANRIVLVTFLSLALPRAALGIGTVSALASQAETVDATGVIGGYSSLAIDGAGGAHITYNGDDALRYASADLPPPLNAAFDPVKLPCVNCRGYSFFDRSTGTPTSWLWDFGDGATSTGQSASHDYRTNGHYNVTLTVSDGTASDTASVLLSVSTAGDPVLVPGGANQSTDPDNDGLYEDVNGNGRKDFADVVLYFNQMAWLAANGPTTLFDYNWNGRIDFADVVWLFNNLAGSPGGTFTVTAVAIGPGTITPPGDIRFGRARTSPSPWVSLQPYRRRTAPGAAGPSATTCSWTRP